MLKDELHDVLKKRMQLDPNDDYEAEKCCKLEIELLSGNIGGAIDFLENECTGEEFAWISEVFDEIVEKSQSKEFIDCLYRVALKFPAECKEYNIYYFIDSAKGFLD